MRLAWLTDIHLDWVERAVIESFARDVRAARPDAVLIGGDIGLAGDVASYLELLLGLLRRPIFFVLGNHDFYGGSIAGVRADVAGLAGRTRDLTWLSNSGPVSLTARTALIGHDGWGDGGFGNAESSPILLNDFLLIEELRDAGEGPPLLARLRALGEEAAAHCRGVLTQALHGHERVIALTHVPPFQEAAWHQERQSNDDWLPFFACKAAGEALREVMARRPDRRLTVLCGHTHSGGLCQPSPNIEVVTGSAEYGRPRLQRIIEIE